MTHQFTLSLNQTNHMYEGSLHIVSDSKMDKWSPLIHHDTRIFSKMQYCTIEGCCSLRRIKLLHSIAEKIWIGMLSHLWSIIVTYTPHGGNDTWKTSKLKSCS